MSTLQTEDPRRGPAPSNRDAPRAASSTGWRRWQRQFVERPIIALVILLVLLVAIAGAVIPNYLSVAQAGAVLRNGSVLGLLAAGQTILILTGGFDLSVAWIAVAAGYCAAFVGSSVSLPAGIAAALGIGILAGLINGVGIGVFGASPLIITLGMSGVLEGGVLIFAKNAPSTVGNTPDAIIALANNSIGAVPVAALLWAVVTIVVIIMLRRTGFARLLYAVGDNKAACRLAGIPVAGVLVVVYALDGLLAGIAGILLVGLARYPSTNMGDPYLLPSVAAVVVGGTSIAGGRGGYGGTIIGVLLLTVLDGLLTLLNIGQAPQAARDILYGAMVLLLASIYIRTSQQS